MGKIPPKKYWQGKIQKNIDRANTYNKKLTIGGWRVLRFWEHEIKKNPEMFIKKIKHALRR